jgi:hypothetical protein
MLRLPSRSDQLDDAELRDGEALAGRFDDQRRHDGEREWDLDDEDRALGRGRFQLHRAADHFELFRTTSMPTPRPETPVMAPAVEKPGRKMNL